MTLSTTLRVMLPVTPPLPAAPEPQPRAPVAATAGAVAPPQQPLTPTQAATTAATLALRLAERDDRNHPASEARAAVEDARAAYIKASRAAGISPLPLPGL